MKTGDRVVCVNASPIINFNIAPLKVGREYIIYGVMNCDACGKLIVDVGFTRKNLQNHLQCTCGHKSQPEIWWQNSDRFRKVEEKREYLVVKSIIEIEETILS